MTTIHHKAVILAAVVYFAIQSVWFKVFGVAWLAALGTTLAETLNQLGGKPLWPLYATAFACDLIAAYAIAYLLSLMARSGGALGARIGFLLGLGIAGTITVTDYVFELRRPMLMIIDAGCAVVGMMVMGAIIGGWRRKAPVITGWVASGSGISS
jgi:hypothetical protein